MRPSEKRPWLSRSKASDERQGAEQAVEGVGVHAEPARKLVGPGGALGQLVGHAQLGDGAEHLRARHADRLVEDGDLGRYEPVGEGHQAAAGTQHRADAQGGWRAARQN